jgi:tetratricopeptide (TPR) repeat protein
MKSRRWSLKIATALLYLIANTATWAAGAHTNPLNLDPSVREAYVHFYNLDFPGAVDRFERFHARHPGDPQATALLLNAEIFNELYSLDLLDTTFYANDGFLTGRHATQEDPKARDRIFALADEAVQEADWRIGRNSNDIDALFARGWVRSLRCAYMAMVERAFGAGFRLATKARDDETRVLQIDPDYVDAKLVVGVYEYVVGALPWPFKFLIGFAGVTGSKSRGLEMLYDDANRGVLTSVEARTVIALFLRREGHYQEAIKVAQSLKSQYPHDYLFCLEEANLLKDSGAGIGAVNAYRQILADSAKPNYFSQERLELAYFALGEALRGQHHYGEAAQSYEQAAATIKIGLELKIRSFLAAGECRDLSGERQKALADYQAAIAAGPKTSRADTARKLLQSPYRGN